MTFLGDSEHGNQETKGELKEKTEQDGLAVMLKENASTKQLTCLSSELSPSVFSLISCEEQGHRRKITPETGRSSAYARN